MAIEMVMNDLGGYREKKKQKINQKGLSSHNPNHTVVSGRKVEYIGTYTNNHTTIETNYGEV